MSKRDFKGSYEELIFRTRRRLGKHELEAFRESFPVSDRTADQFGLKAVTSIREAEEQKLPWLRRMRRRTR